MDTTLITALAGIAATIVTFILTRKKYNGEVRGKEIENGLDLLEY